MFTMRSFAPVARHRDGTRASSSRLRSIVRITAPWQAGSGGGVVVRTGFGVGAGGRGGGRREVVTAAGRPLDDGTADGAVAAGPDVTTAGAGSSGAVLS